MGSTKKKLLVMTSTFPRWRNDTVPPFVYELSRRMTDKFDVHVLAPYSYGSKQYEKVDGMIIHRFKYFFGKKLLADGAIIPTLRKNKLFWFQVPFFVLSEFRAMIKIIKKEKIDVIHAHWILPQGFLAVLYKKLFGWKGKIVTTSHGSDLHSCKFYKLKAWILNNSNVITVVSNYLKQEVLKLKLRKEIPLEVIPMGVDITKFNPRKKDLKIKEEENIKGPFLLFVGRLSPEKGINTLIDAIPKVIKIYPSAKLIIVGDGTIKEELNKKVKSMKLDQNIIFKGWIIQKELPRYYATADVFVSPSLKEGSPVAWIESLACGTPIIVGDISISKEIVSEAKIGSIVNPKSRDDIAIKIINLIRQNAKKKSVNKNSLLPPRYKWENIVERMKKGIA